MALGPQNQRDQILTAIAIVALALAGAYWYFVYEPRSVEVAALGAHVDSLEAANQKAKAQLAKGTVEQIQEEARGYRENLDLMRTLVPAAHEVVALVDQVSTAARRAGRELAQLEPEPVIEGELFDTHRYRLKVYGTYHALGEVLANIGSMSRIVAPINLQLTLPTTVQKSPPGGQTLQAVFSIQTYVVRTAPPKPAAKAEGTP